MILPTTFWSKVEKTHGCWNWKGGLQGNGYGEFWIGKDKFYTHRLSYEVAKGKIPNGLHIDHLCCNPSCVNPAHLEAVNREENLRRGNPNASKVNSQKTHCPKGHPLSGDNLIAYELKHGTRKCRACDNARKRERYRRNTS